MNKEIGLFVIRLLSFSLLLFCVHYYILFQFFSTDLYFPLWTIYCFNGVLVLVVYLVLRYYANKIQKDMLKVFLGLTMLKMMLAIIFLLPLFLKKSDHVQLEVFNFFIPYFLFLSIEIISLNNFLQKS